MKILHYSLGLPPFRSGGLTKYSLDLMKAQVQQNEQVSLLYPGHYNISKNTKIISNKKKYGINVYELVNPLPIPLLGGIKNPKLFYQEVDKNIYYNFLNNNKPDIIHIHTLMGIHKEFIDAANELNIKTIFTTHDYFGICPKVNMINHNGKLCENTNDFNKCITCNKNGFGLNKIKVMQSLTYRKVKELGLINQLKKIKKIKNTNKPINEVTNQDNNEENIENKILLEEYISLNNYYMSMLEKIDYIHFNSSITKDIYSKYKIKKGEVLNISHSDIRDNRKTKKITIEEKPLNIGYMGDILDYKGFFKLKESLDTLLEQGINNWKLNIYGNSTTPIYNKEYYDLHGKYSYSDLDNIFENIDVLIIPSICKETFGFIGLEALSYGVPTIVSNNVGFKDIVIENNCGIVFDIDSDELINIIKDIVNDRSILKNINKNILSLDFNYTIKNHENDIKKLYKRIIEGRI